MSLILLCALSVIPLSACTPDADPRTGSKTDPLLFEIAGHSYSASGVTTFKLPKSLREISGLALDAEGRLHAHNDERAIIFRIDFDSGRIEQRLELVVAVEDGDDHRKLKKDFEGIAIVDDQVFLTTSHGVLYQAEREYGDPVQSDALKRSGRLDCEVEGLAADRGEDQLLVACKNLSTDSPAGLRVHGWSRSTREYDLAASYFVPQEDIDRVLLDHGLPATTLQPTGITIAPNGNLIVIAGRQHLLLELTPTSQPVRLGRLSASRHPQAEGIAMTDDGRLLIADEGDGKGNKKTRGRLTVYEPVAHE